MIIHYVKISSRYDKMNEISKISASSIMPINLRQKSKLNIEDVVEVVADQNESGNSAGISCYDPSDMKTERPSIFRPKSPTKRVFECPKLKKCSLHRWRAIDSIRKTRSTALPAIELSSSNWQPRVETVSSPDFTEDAPRIYGDSNYERSKVQNENRQIILLNREAICYDNVRWICIFLNCVILVLSALYFGSALAFTISRDVLLLIMGENTFSSMLAFFYILTFILWALPISGLYLLWKMSRNISYHVVVSLLIGVVTVTLILVQNSTEKFIEENVEMHLRFSIMHQNDNLVKDSWDYLHKTFKCCGVNGFLDWCDENTHDKTNNYSDQLRKYECSSILVNSCCLRYKKEYDDYEELERITTCHELYNAGCIVPIKREIRHLGKMYNIMTGGVSGVLVISSIMTMVLYSRLSR